MEGNSQDKTPQSYNMEEFIMKANHEMNMKVINVALSNIAMRMIRESDMTRKQFRRTTQKLAALDAFKKFQKSSDIAELVDYVEKRSNKLRKSVQNSTLTINTWVNLQAEDFDNFGETIATMFERAICNALLETFADKLTNHDSYFVELPWGTFRASVVNKGEGSNVNLEWSASEAFEKQLNGDSGDEVSSDYVVQDTFDPVYLNYFKELVAWGVANHEDPANKDKIPDKKGVLLSDDEAAYFLNSYMYVLSTLAKTKQRDGKIFRLPIDATGPFGAYEFEYNDDVITARFIPDKYFKQSIKDDAMARKIKTNDFTKVTEVRVTTTPVENPDETAAA